MPSELVKEKPLRIRGNGNSKSGLTWDDKCKEKVLGVRSWHCQALLGCAEASPDRAGRLHCGQSRLTVRGFLVLPLTRDSSFSLLGPTPLRPEGSFHSSALTIDQPTTGLLQAAPWLSPRASSLDCIPRGLAPAFSVAVMAGKLSPILSAVGHSTRMCGQKGLVGCLKGGWGTACAHSVGSVSGGP